MLRARTGRKHDRPLKDEIARLIKRNGAHTGQLDPLLRSNLSHGRVNRSRIDGRGLVPRQSEQHGSVRPVAHPGECQRTKQLYRHTLDLLKLAASFEFTRKPAGRAHRAHGMRARWTNADFVQVEQTRSHAEDCSVKQESRADSLAHPSQLDESAGKRRRTPDESIPLSAVGIKPYLGRLSKMSGGRPLASFIAQSGVMSGPSPAA